MFRVHVNKSAIGFNSFRYKLVHARIANWSNASFIHWFAHYYFTVVKCASSQLQKLSRQIYLKLIRMRGLIHVQGVLWISFRLWDATSRPVKILVFQSVLVQIMVTKTPKMKIKDAPSNSMSWIWCSSLQVLLYNILFK